MRTITRTALVVLLAAAAYSAAAYASDGSLLVLSKGDHTLAIVDPGTMKVLGKVPVGEDPHEVIASSDGRFAFVSNYGGGAYNTLALIDLVGMKSLGSIDLGPLRGPHGLAFVGGKTWFTAEAAKAIGRYDPTTKKVDWILGTGQNRTHMIWVSPDMQTIYTTNVSSATVSIIEHVAPRSMPPPPSGAPHLPSGAPPRPMGPPGGDWNETVVPVGHGSEGFDVRPDGKEIWVANAQDATVSIIDLSAKRVSETLHPNVAGANRLKFTPDGKLVFISSLGDAGLTVLDAASHKEIKRFPIPPAAGIEIQPDGSRVYVASTGGSYVAVIDPKTLEITGKIDAGPQPDGMAWSSNKR